MVKIVYNSCHGGFGLSEQAILRYAELNGFKLYVDKRKPYNLYYKVPVEEYDKLEAEANRTKDYSATREVIFSAHNSLERDDPVLVQVVEELGAEANGDYARLDICDIPAGTRWRIREYDGYESIETPGDIDWNIA